MYRSAKLGLSTALVVIAMLGLVGCPGAPGVPGGLPGGGGKVDPAACGSYSASKAGKKLKAFLEALVELDTQVQSTASSLVDTCAAMGAKLGLGELKGDPKEVCGKVAQGIKDNLSVGLKAGAQLTVNYEPAVCEVNVEAAASAAASCEAEANAEVGVTCSGQCSGTCSGACEGECASTNAEGQCEGECKGTCAGSCSGSCDGHADVNASAACEAHAEVSANVEAKCTEPKVEVTFEAGAVVDDAKIQAVKEALETGLGGILMLKAKIEGPLKGAVATTYDSAKELKGALGDMRDALKDQFMCISGQFAAAANLAAGIVASIDVQVEVSVEVSASASASGGAAAGG
jgi:modification target Cys-rich repeat protein